MNNHYNKVKRKAKKILFAVLLIVLTVVLLYPVLVMLSVSLKENSDVFTVPVTLIPEKFAWHNFADVFIKMDTLQAFANSLIVTGGSLVVTMIIAIPCAYALSKLKFVLKKPFYYMVLVTQMFSPVVVIIPLYKLLNAWGLIDTYVGLIAMNVTFNLAFIVLMPKSNFDNVPTETIEAATIDGCSRFGTLIRVMLPISSLGIVVSVIYVFTRCWNEFLFAFTFTSSSSMKTIIVKLYEILKNNPAYGIPWELVMSGAVIVTIPLITLFMLIRNYITGDATKGAIK